MWLGQERHSVGRIRQRILCGGASGGSGALLRLRIPGQTCDATASASRFSHRWRSSSLSLVESGCGWVRGMVPRPQGQHQTGTEGGEQGTTGVVLYGDRRGRAHSSRSCRPEPAEPIGGPRRAESVAALQRSSRLRWPSSTRVARQAIVSRGARAMAPPPVSRALDAVSRRGRGTTSGAFPACEGGTSNQAAAGGAGSASASISAELSIRVPAPSRSRLDGGAAFEHACSRRLGGGADRRRTSRRGAQQAPVAAPMLLAGVDHQKGAGCRRFHLAFHPAGRQFWTQVAAPVDSPEHGPDSTPAKGSSAGGWGAEVAWQGRKLRRRRPAPRRRHRVRIPTDPLQAPSAGAAACWRSGGIAPGPPV